MKLKATFCLCTYTLASLDLKIILQLSPSSSSSNPTYAQAMSSEMGQSTYKCNIAYFLGFVFNVYNIIIIKDIVGLCHIKKSLFSLFKKKKHTKALLCFSGFVFRVYNIIMIKLVISRKVFVFTAHCVRFCPTLCRFFGLYCVIF